MHDTLLRSSLYSLRYFFNWLFTVSATSPVSCISLPSTSAKVRPLEVWTSRARVSAPPSSGSCETVTVLVSAGWYDQCMTAFALRNLPEPIDMIISNCGRARIFSSSLNPSRQGVDLAPGAALDRCQSGLDRRQVENGQRALRF